MSRSSISNQSATKPGLSPFNPLETTPSIQPAQKPKEKTIAEAENILPFFSPSLQFTATNFACRVEGSFRALSKKKKKENEYKQDDLDIPPTGTLKAAAALPKTRFSSPL